MTRFLLFILAACLSHAAFSFNEKDTTEQESHIERYPDRFYLKPIYTFRNLSMDIRGRKENSRVEYKPNGNAYLGLGAYLFNIGVELSFRIPNNEKSIGRYGETDYLDLQSNLYYKKWGADIAYQRYEGFYVDNPIEHYNGWAPGKPFPQRGDLTIRHFNLSAFYVFNNEHLSYRSAYNQADRQLKSAGSVLIGMEYLNQAIYADSSLIPKDSRNDFNVDQFNKANLGAVGLLPGYTYTFIWKYLYVNMSASGGPAIVRTEYTEDGFSLDDVQLSLFLDLRAGIGYNSPRWFAGLTYLNQQSNMVTKNLDITVNSGNIKLFIGYRFNEVGFLKKDPLKKLF